MISLFSFDIEINVAAPGQESPTSIFTFVFIFFMGYFRYTLINWNFRALFFREAFAFTFIAVCE
jgi:hypothetical protein